MKKSLNIFTLIAFIALLFPMLAGFMKKDKNPHLTGIVINNNNPDSLLKKDKSLWFSGEYQNLKMITITTIGLLKKNLSA